MIDFELIHVIHFIQFITNLFTWIKINPDSSVFVFEINARVRPSIFTAWRFSGREVRERGGLEHSTKAFQKFLFFLYLIK